MITQQQIREARKEAGRLIRGAGLLVRDDEIASIEVADFGLGNLELEGAQILTLLDTERIAVKLLALTSFQHLPEHWHPRLGDDPGKEETLRVLFGEMSIVREGPESLRDATIPQGKEAFYTCRHEMRAKPGDQLTISPGDKHWFQAGASGAVAFSFSSTARDILDGFTDPGIRRKTVVMDNREVSH